MPKIIKYILIGFSILFFLVIIIPFAFGLFGALKPKESFEAGKQAKIQMMDEKEIIQKVSEKLNFPTEEASLTINNREEFRAVGTISYKGNNETYWWIGIKTTNPDTRNTQWGIIANGDSTSMVNCAILESTNYPINLVSTCYDTKLQEVVKRSK